MSLLPSSSSNSYSEKPTKTRSLVDAIRGCLESVTPLLFPPFCVLCGEPTERVSGENRTHQGRRFAAFCRVCETSMRQSGPMMRTACEQCGWPRGARSVRTTSAPCTPPLQVSSAEGSPADDSQSLDPENVIGGEPAGLLACPKCHARPASHCFDRVTPLYRYQDAARDAVVAAKYPRNAVVAYELAVALAERCRSRWLDLDACSEVCGTPSGRDMIVTSVPSPWIRQVRRGGSGTRLLAQYTAKQLRLPYVSLLQTVRPIAKQALLDDGDRRENVRGAFRIRSHWLQRLRGREVLLVDDVMTTGATADEIAGVLRDGGSGRISLAVAALAMREPG